jgi:hypothetical protein
MTWMILIALVMMLLLLSFVGQWPVSWAKNMKRINAGSRDQAEWMAPEMVIDQVRDAYLKAMAWLPESQMLSWSEQWSKAPGHFSGEYLKAHQKILKHQSANHPQKYVGILRCVHDVTVRNFSEDGERCLVIDHQTERRMATYNTRSQERMNTQDLGEGTLVYQMAYDKHAKCWKIDRFIQQLPVGWQSKGKSPRMLVRTTLPPVTGRDH